MSQFFHRLFISILSVILFSAVISSFQYLFADGEQFGFGLLLGIYSFYAAPVFILGGIPASYVVDRYIKKHKETCTKLQTYFRSFGLYGIAGMTVVMIYAAITSIANGKYFFTILESLQNILIGLAAAFVYFHITLLLQINWEKLKKQYPQQEAEKSNSTL